MPLTRPQKEESVKQMEQALTGAMSVIFVTFDGLTLPDVNDLRNRLFAEGCSMRVISKRLLKLALTKAKLEFDPVSQEGQLAVIWGNDPVTPAKILYGFTKDHDTLQLKAGALEGTMISLEQVKALAQLPSRDEMLGKLVRTLAGPMRGLAVVLLGVQRNMLYVLSAIKEQKAAA